MSLPAAPSTDVTVYADASTYLRVDDRWQSIRSLRGRSVWATAHNFDVDGRSAFLVPTLTWVTIEPMALIEPPPVQLLRAHIRAGTRWFIWRFTHEAPASDGWAAVADRAQFDAAETPVQRWWTDEHVQFQPWFTKDTAPTAFGPDIFAITRLSGLRLLAVRRIHRNIPGHLL